MADAHKCDNCGEMNMGRAPGRLKLYDDRDDRVEYDDRRAYPNWIVQLCEECMADVTQAIFPPTDQYDGPLVDWEEEVGELTGGEDDG